MFCTNCGKELPENALFCPSCGKSIFLSLLRQVLFHLKLHP